MPVGFEARCGRGMLLNFYWLRAGKSLFARDCVVGLGGLELLTKRLSAAGSEQSGAAARSSCVLTAVSDHSGPSSAAAISAPVNQCGEPWFTRVSEITVWFEVRVLPAPPRSLVQAEISRLVANSPELAGIRVRSFAIRRCQFANDVLIWPSCLSVTDLCSKRRGRMDERRAVSRKFRDAARDRALANR
jgi:hypothetical protein